jgi:serine/threonine-protein kinase
VAPQGGNFGAIAFSPATGATGYTYDMPTREVAEERALQQCGARCRTVLWFRNACGALAVGNNGFGSAWAPQQRAAALMALDRCRQRTSECRIKVTACAGRWRGAPDEKAGQKR